MKLLVSPRELENEFKRLLKQYEQFYWAIAWAGESQLFDELILQKKKIKKIVVGLHFYQTHPNFIEEFLDDERVQFIRQPSGTFHPKIYLFTDSESEWEILLGSANFTHQAFTRNREVMILLTNEDKGTEDVFKNAIKFIKESWNQAEIFDDKELRKYRIAWKNHQTKIKSLSGQYGSKKLIPKPIFNVPIMNKSWDEFIKEVLKEKFHGLGRRLKVIEISRNLFAKAKHFSQLKEDERKFIAGIPNNLANDWGYFGSMQGAGIFKNRIKNNDINISKGLDEIPFSGQITKSHYDNFLKYFTKTFKGNYLATATRLLSMKRPDVFVCLDSKNKSALCKDFGIIQSEMNYERYWEDIIERIYDSDWWLNPNPSNSQEMKVSAARAAFLDSLYYVE